VGDYVASNKINAQKTAKGTFVEVKSAGDGPAVDSGKLGVCSLYRENFFHRAKYLNPI